MTLPDDRWEQITPYCYILRGYTVEQIAAIDRRPSELINEAVRNAKRIAVEPRP